MFVEPAELYEQYIYRNGKLSTVVRVVAKVTKVERCEICRNGGSEIVNLVLLPDWAIFSGKKNGRKFLQALGVNDFAKFLAKCRKILQV